MTDRIERLNLVRDWAVEQVRLGYALRGISSALEGRVTNGTINDWARSCGVKSRWPFPLPYGQRERLLRSGVVRDGRPFVPKNILEIARAELEPPKRRVKVTAEHVEKVKLVQGKGLTNRQIADLVGCSPTSVWRIVLGQYDDLLAPAAPAAVEPRQESKPTPPEPAPPAIVDPPSEPLRPGQAPAGCVHVKDLEASATLLREGWTPSEVAELLALNQAEMRVISKIVEVARGGAA